MTHELVYALASVKGSLQTRLLAVCLTLLVLPFAATADLVRRAKRERILAEVANHGTARCPRGHAVSLVSSGWTCSCGVTSPGHAFLPCPACGAIGHISCPCSLTVRNPLVGRFR